MDSIFQTVRRQATAWSIHIILEFTIKKKKKIINNPNPIRIESNIWSSWKYCCQYVWIVLWIDFFFVIIYHVKQKNNNNCLLHYLFFYGIGIKRLELELELPNILLTLIYFSSKRNKRSRTTLIKEMNGIFSSTGLIVMHIRLMKIEKYKYKNSMLKKLKGTTN